MTWLSTAPTPLGGTGTVIGVPFIYRGRAAAEEFMELIEDD
jgi:hypothetical protein